MSTANPTTSIIQFENRHIMPIPENERTGNVWTLFAIWVGINMLPLTVVTGAVASGSFGLSIPWSITAILAGNLIGAFGAALHASQGPHLGVPQMLQARAQFGYKGGSLLAVIALIMYLGFFTSILIVAKDSLIAVFPDLNPALVIIVFGAVGISVAVVGYDLLQKAMAALSTLIAVAVVVSMVGLFLHPDAFPARPEAGFSVEGFFGMLAIGIVWQLAYAPYVSDYSRYLPKNTGPKSAFMATYFGLVLSSVFVMILGVLLGAIAPDSPMTAIFTVLGPVGAIVLVVFALTAAFINAAELYSGVMCGLTALQSFFPKLVITSRTRVITTIVCGSLAIAAAVLSSSDFLTMFLSFIDLLLYVLIPWSAINLVDYFVLRKGEYQVSAFFDPNGRYGRWNARGLVTYAIGLLVQVPFMATEVFTGPIGAQLGGIDIAWVVGLLVSGVLYYFLMRREVAAEPDPVPEEVVEVAEVR